LELRVVGRLEPGAALVAHDLVLLDAADARHLLGVPAGHASDLALDVFHVAEEEAILPDLARAFPWPVQVTTRRDALGAYTGGLARRGGIALLAAVPSLLAVVLLALVAVRDRASRRWEVGLLKACGWTTGDVLRFHALRALAIGIPAAVLGLATAYGLVLWPGTTWPGSWLLGWDGPPPPLHLSAGGAALLLVEVTALAVCPWLVATLASALYAAATDPQAALEARV
jgi:ABC-type lipoprotein release transport system permease subunit